MRSPEPMDARRRVELARIHIQSKQLGLDDDTYRAMLRQLTGKESTKSMTTKDRARVLDFLSQQLGKRRQPEYPGRPHNIESRRAPQVPSLRKIEAFLAEAGRPWAYADAMAKRIAKVERCAFLDEEGAQKILAALWYDAQRHGRRTA